jgi:hypothetical protein
MADKVLEAAELAGKDAVSATSEVTVEIVSHRYCVSDSVCLLCWTRSVYMCAD